MRKMLSFLIIIMLFGDVCFATLTPGTIPVDKTGGSSPTIQDGSITDTGVSGTPGNVGIGSVTPTQKVDIVGNIHASGFGKFDGVVDSVINGSGGNVGIGTNSIVTVQVGIVSPNNVTGLAIAAPGNTTYLSNSNVSQGLLVQGNTGLGTFAPTSLLQVGAHLLQVTSAGNVGVGSATPGQALDVNGTVRSTNLTVTGLSTGCVTNTSGVFSSTGTSCGGSGTSANPSASIGLSAVNGSATTFMTSDSAPPLSQAISPTWTGNHIFAPSSGNTLFSAGNVGIGTAIPQNSLCVGTTCQGAITSGGTINGVLMSLTDTTAGSNTITILKGSATSGGIFNGASSNNTASGNLFGVTQSGTSYTGDVMKIVRSGASSTGNDLRITASGGTGNVALFEHATSDTAPVVITSTGNVGIGTTTAGQLLDVKGTIRNFGSFMDAGTSPTLTSCGGSPSVTSATGQYHFTVTVGTTATACTATFANPCPVSSTCNVTNQSMSVTNAMTYVESASAITVSQAVGLSGDVLDINCTCH